MNRSSLFSCFLFALILSASAPAANIVLNPGFESGLSNWTTVGDLTWMTSPIARSGTGSVVTACAPAECITTPRSGIFQDLSTVSGTDYVFSFWFRNTNGTPNHLQVLAGGNVLTNLIDQPGDAIWYPVTLGFTANSSTTRIQFNGRQLPGAVRIDDVCVDAVGGACGLAPSAIPEPGTWLTAGVALLLLAGYARRPAAAGQAR